MSQDAKALQQTHNHHLLVEEVLSRGTGRSLHDIRLFLLGLENNRAGGIDDEFEEGDMHGFQDQGPAKENGTERKPGDGDVDREDVRHRLFQIVENAASKPDGLNNGREIIIQQNKVRGFASHIGSPLAHGNANVRGFQRRGVIHSVAGHRDDLAVGLQRVDQLKLLLGHGAGKDACLRNPVAESLIIHRRDFRTRDCPAALSSPIWRAMLIAVPG